MSERITHELRLFLADPYREWAPKEKKDQELKDALDNIDAINANLERENESLRRELDRVLGEEHDFAPESHYMMLPKDADGVPIHVGDVLEHTVDSTHHGKASRFMLESDGSWWVYVNSIGCKPSAYRHHTPDSWERIIADAAATRCDFDDLVARCKALAGDPECPPPSWTSWSICGARA